MSNNSQIINLTPSPSALIQSLRSIGYTLDTALADIIDNSITALAKNISVRFEWNKKNTWIAVVDDGCGMTKDELIDAMRFGSRSPREERDPNDLGRFGLGLKTASISQCKILSVATFHKKKLHGCTMDLDKLNDQWSAEFLIAESVKKDKVLFSLCDDIIKNGSGTVVLWRNLDSIIGETFSKEKEKAFSTVMDRSRKHIETVFHRFFKSGNSKNALSINFNNSPLRPFDPFGTKSLALQELPDEKIDIEGHIIKVQPFVLPHHSKISKSAYRENAGSEGYLENQGFYVYRNQRLIIKSTWFRLIKKEELNKLIRIRVDIPNALDHLWKIDVKKSNATPPQEVLKNLKRIIGRIEISGKRVFKKRASIIQSKKTIPVWTRTAVEGKIKYIINENHPVLENITEEMDGKFVTELRAFLRMVGDAFPQDVYYADLADDETIIDEGTNIEDIRQVISSLLESMTKAGLDNKIIKEKILGMEIPGLTNEILCKILNGKIA